MMEDKNDSKHVRINISLPEDLVQRLVKYSDEEDIPRSRVIKKALEKLLTEKGY